jgi:hypothetical protein
LAPVNTRLVAPERPQGPLTVIISLGDNTIITALYCPADRMDDYNQPVNRR